MSGPISRYNDFKGAFDQKITYSSRNMEEGFYLIIKGLFMKLVIANRLVDYIDRVFDNYLRHTGLALWTAVLFFIGCLFVREWYEEKRKLSVDTVAKLPWQVFLLSSMLLFGSFGTSGFIYANF